MAAILTRPRPGAGRGGAGRNHRMVMSYADQLRLFRTPWQKVGILLALITWLVLPLHLDRKWLDVDFLGVLNLAAVYAIGAIGLNLLIGYTGQVSLGHAFFMGVGGYMAAWLGDDHGIPLPVYLLAAAAAGAVLGAVIGPFALRLRGDYLVVVTVGLVFLGDHIFNIWRSVTGGPGGRSVAAGTNIGPVEIENLSAFGREFSKEQGIFWFCWFLVGVCALLAKNLVRSRPGRAMQAVRDRDLSAEVIGVSLARYKIGAFAVSSAMAAVAGVLYGVFIQGFLSPVDFGLTLSINFVAMIIIGGIGTIFGSIVGAVIITSVPRLIESNSDLGALDWLLKEQTDTGFGLQVPAFNLILFGALIVAFLIFEPRGLAAVWFRLKAYFRTWPFSY